MARALMLRAHVHVHVHAPARTRARTCLQLQSIELARAFAFTRTRFQTFFDQHHELRHAQACPFGRVSVAAGSVNCSECDAGSVPLSDGSACSICGRGLYSNGTACLVR
jgi:hypothetical protein